MEHCGLRYGPGSSDRRGWIARRECGHAPCPVQLGLQLELGLKGVGVLGEAEQVFGRLGVLPEFEHMGIAAALYIEHFETAARTGLTHGEAGWILEDNRSMNRGLEAMGGRIVKRCRIYERDLGTA